MPVNKQIQNRITIVMLFAIPVIAWVSRVILVRYYSDYVLLHSLKAADYITEEQVNVIENAAVNKFNVRQKLNAVNILNNNGKYRNVDNILSSLLGSESELDMEERRNVWLMFCRNAYSMQDVAQAVNRFTQYVEHYPDDKDAMIELAGLYLQISQKQKAVSLYLQLIEKYNTDISLYLALADIALSDPGNGEKQQDNYIFARQILEQAIAVEPSKELYKKLAFVLSAQGKHSEAVEMLQKCLPFGLDDPQLCIALAVAIQELHQVPGSLLDIFYDINDEVVVLEIVDEKLILPFARASLILGRNDKANLLYLKFLALHPDDLDVMFEYANFLHNDRQYGQAEIYYCHILNNNVRNYSLFTRDVILLQAARNAVRNSDIQLAFKRYKSYLTLKPSDAKVIIEASSVLRQNDMALEADMLCRAHLKYILQDYNDKGGDDCLALEIARIYVFINDFSQALHWYDLYCSVNHGDEQARLEQARLAGWNLEYSRASAYYLDMFNYFNDLVYKTELLAKKNNWIGRYILAARYYEELLDDKPDDVELLYDLAQIYDRLGVNHKAEALYSEIVSDHPWHIQASKALIAEAFRKKQSASFYSVYSDDSGRNGDVDIRRFSSRISYSPQRELADRKWQFALATDRLSLNDIDTTKNSASISMSDMLADDLNLNIDLGFNDYSVSSFDSFEISSELEKKFEYFNASVLAGKQDYITNSLTYFDKTDRKYIGAEFYTRPFFYTSLGFTAKHYWVSDGNRSAEYDIRAEYELLKYPTILKTIFDSYFYQTREFDTKYWSPDYYNSNSIGLGWYHYLDNENFEGSVNFYYYLEGYIGLDNDREGINTAKAGIVYETNKNIDLGVEYFISSSDVYDSMHLSTYLLIRW